MQPENMHTGFKTILGPISYNSTFSYFPSIYFAILYKNNYLIISEPYSRICTRKLKNMVNKWLRLWMKLRNIKCTN